LEGEPRVWPREVRVVIELLEGRSSSRGEKGLLLAKEDGEVGAAREELLEDFCLRLGVLQMAGEEESEWDGRWGSSERSRRAWISTGGLFFSKSQTVAGEKEIVEGREARDSESGSSLESELPEESVRALEDMRDKADESSAEDTSEDMVRLESSSRESHRESSRC
jgi:hypothetical protein